MDRDSLGIHKKNLRMDIEDILNMQLLKQVIDNASFDPTPNTDLQSKQY